MLHTDVRPPCRADDRQRYSNLQNMHEKSLPPTGARMRIMEMDQDWARFNFDAR